MGVGLVFDRFVVSTTSTSRVRAARMYALATALAFVSQVASVVFVTFTAPHDKAISTHRKYIKKAFLLWIGWAGLEDVIYCLEEHQDGYTHIHAVIPSWPYTREDYAKLVHLWVIALWKVGLVGDDDLFHSKLYLRLWFRNRKGAYRYARAGNLRGFIKIEEVPDIQEEEGVLRYITKGLLEYVSKTNRLRGYGFFQHLWVIYRVFAKRRVPNIVRRSVPAVRKFVRKVYGLSKWSFVPSGCLVRRSLAYVWAYMRDWFTVEYLYDGSYIQELRCRVASVRDGLDDDDDMIVYLAYFFPRFWSAVRRFWQNVSVENFYLVCVSFAANYESSPGSNRSVVRRDGKLWFAIDMPIRRFYRYDWVFEDMLYELNDDPILYYLTDYAYVV